MDRTIVKMTIDDNTYEGRLLGLITDKEFNILVNNTKVQKRILTSETVTLESIWKDRTTLNGMRIVIAIRKINDVTRYKSLFITQRLGMVNYTNPNAALPWNSEIGVLGDNSDDIIYIKEAELLAMKNFLGMEQKKNGKD